MSFIERDCPICEKPIESKKGIIPDINPDNILNNIDYYWRGFHKEKVFFNYSRCCCGVLYCKKYFSNEQLSKLYSNMSDNVHSGDIETDLYTKDSYIKSILNNLKKEKPISILELGSDNGSLLKKLQTKIPIKKIVAVEPNVKMHAKLEKIADNVYSDLSDVPELDKFDLIICIHVLDHIPDINKLINSLYLKLNNSGYLFGVVHDESSLLAKILGNRWPAYCLQHPQLFNERTIKKMFEKHNLTEIKTYKTINVFKFGYLLEQLLLAFFKIKINLPNLFNVHLKLGNIGFFFRK